MLRNYWKYPNFDDLWLTNWLELLFNFYKYWVDYNSNCLLINEQKEILWIQWNGMPTTEVISIMWPKGWTVAINNKYAIKRNLHLEDYYDIFAAFILSNKLNKNEWIKFISKRLPENVEETFNSLKTREWVEKVITSFRNEKSKLW